MAAPILNTQAAQEVLDHLPAVLGHRGAPASAPENTLAGFRAASGEGAKAVEFDVMLTADLRAVVFHDETLERTTDGAGPVAGQTLEMLSAYSAGLAFGGDFGAEMIPTLEETIDLLAQLKMGANIEVKPNDPDRQALTGEIVAETVADVWPENLPAPLMSSFSREALAAVKEAASHLPRMLVAERLPKDWLDAARQLGLAGFSLGEKDLQAADVKSVKDAGLALMVWTVNDPARAVGLRALGVDAVITDLPAQVLQALRGGRR